MKTLIKALQALYFIWGFFSFVIIFLLLLPLFLVIIPRKKCHSYVYYLNKLWAKVLFALGLIPIKVVYKFKPKSEQPYIYCPNHTSYLDIATCSYAVDRFIVFVGKNALSKIPIFGYMFGKVHIAVDRESKTHSYRAYQQAKQEVKTGKSLLIFPEGGIKKGNAPQLNKFKNGPFKVAIGEQMPIVPVTIPYNWKILYSDEVFLKWHVCKIIFHEPIETKNLSSEDVSTIREQTYRIIQNEIEKHN